MTEQKWQQLVRDKRRRQQEAIPKDWLVIPPPPVVLDVRTFPDTCGLLSDREVEITNTSDVDILLKKLATAEWSAVEVTTAFYKRAIVAHQLVNCLTEIFVERALARAAELDEHLKRTGQVAGPLHGLPISLKDQICIKGLEATMGYASWVGKYSDHDAVMTQILYECGAIPFVMTNVPQTLLWSETFNYVYGRTSNPANRTLTSGGSSGGEGALIGMKGSPLGIGSDLGGSVRYPSSFNGLYGLRPSYGRLPYSGCVNSLEGQDSSPSSLGPISDSLNGIKTFMRAVLSKEPWLRDPLCVRKKWDEEAYRLEEHGGGQKLCFGIIWDDGHVAPQPPVLRALQMTKKALEAAGHAVIDWQALKHQELYECLATIWIAGAISDISATTAETGEPRITSMSPEADPLVDTGVHYSSGISAYELWQVQKKRTTLREEYLAHWRATAARTGTGRPVDAIISPVAPFPPPPHGKTTISTYTMVWSALNYTCCAFPVTSVDPLLDAKKSPDAFFSEADKENYELYDPETFKNAPVGLQLVGGSLEEEAVIAMTELVDAALKAVPVTA
ncbi:general amidase [Pilatotrama ljubarskyi]|nr:general amidase [Pilatotrama ljubarskyi]